MSLRAAASCLPCFLALAVGLAACKKTPKPADAGTGASPAFAVAVDASSRRDPTLGLVAEGHEHASLHATTDGRVVLLSGSVSYEAKDSGALEPVVSPDALAPLFPDDEALVGFVPPSTRVLGVHGALAGPLLLEGEANERRSFVVAGGRLQPTSLAEVRHVVRWRGRLLGANRSAMSWLEGEALPAPRAAKGFDVITGLAVREDGALVAISHEPYGRLRAAVYAAGGKLGDAPMVIHGEAFTSCALVPSFDASVVVRCDSGWPTFLRVEGDDLEPAFPDARRRAAAASIGKDHALYVALADELAVVRCPAPAGACTPIAIAGDLSGDAAAHYQTDVTDVVSRDGTNSWVSVSIETTPEVDGAPTAEAILARGEDDVWLLARSPRRSLVLHAGARKERVVLPTLLDARVLARSSRPAQLWTGHCEQVFVRLGAAGSEAIALRAADIQKALGTEPAGDAAFQWWLVEGTLDDERVVGVVAARRDAEEPLAKMEAALERLVEAFSPNPMSKPRAYCTLPVLERRLFPAQR